MKPSDAVLILGVFAVIALVFMGCIAWLIHSVTSRTVVNVTQALSKGVTDLVNPQQPQAEVEQTTVQDAVMTEALKAPWEMWGSESETEWAPPDPTAIDNRGGPM